MPIEVAHLTAGQLLPAKFDASTLRELAIVEPEGVYTITRTYQGDHTVLLDAHFDRLEESARLEGLDLSLNRSQLRSGLRELIIRAGYSDSRLRITVPINSPETIILAAEPLKRIPQALKEQGVMVATVELARTNPRVKSNSWEQQRSEAAKGLPSEAYEGLLVNDAGHILEGFSSNFYGVIGLTLRTADEGILHGISRRILLEILPADLAVIAKPVTEQEIAHLDEAFISSSSRGLVPVVAIDDRKIRAGAPGEITIELSKKFNAWVNAHLEPI